MSNPENKNSGSKPKNESKLGGVVNKIKTIKHLDIIIAVVVVLVMLIIYFSTFFGDSSSDSSGSSSAGKDYCSAVVVELEEKLSKVSGAGQVSVLINWKCSEEMIPATSSSASGSTNIVTVGGEVYILKIVYPTPVGVIIICDGGNNISIKVSLISAVSSYFGISENTITVLAKSSK